MRSSTSDLPPEAPQVEAGRDERNDTREEEVYEEGQEVAEEEPFEKDDRREEVEGEGEDDDDEDEGKLEWPAGVAQASERDLAKLAHKEGVGTGLSAALFGTENKASILSSSDLETFSVALPKPSSSFLTLTKKQKVPFNPCKRQTEAVFQ